MITALLSLNRTNHDRLRTALPCIVRIWYLAVLAKGTSRHFFHSCIDTYYIICRGSPQKRLHSFLLYFFYRNQFPINQCKYFGTVWKLLKFPFFQFAKVIKIISSCFCKKFSLNLWGNNVIIHNHLIWIGYRRFNVGFFPISRSSVWV